MGYGPIQPLYIFVNKIIDDAELTMELYPDKLIISSKYIKSKMHLIHLIYQTP